MSSFDDIKDFTQELIESECLTAELEGTCKEYDTLAHKFLDLVNFAFDNDIVTQGGAFMAYELIMREVYLAGFLSSSTGNKELQSLFYKLYNSFKAAVANKNCGEVLTLLNAMTVYSDLTNMSSGDDAISGFKKLCSFLSQ